MAEIAGMSETELRRTDRASGWRRPSDGAAQLAGSSATPRSRVACRESTMWRWIARGAPPSRAPRGVVASERAVELLLQWRGNVAAVHRQLRDEGEAGAVAADAGAGV